MFRPTQPFHHIFFVTIIALSLCCSACNKLFPKTPKCLPPSVLTDSEKYPKPTENLTVDVFFDSTLSMQGFTKTNSYSYYQQTIPLLERPIINSGGQANFYKFGTIVREEKLPERSYRDADKPAFYTDSDLTSKTEIQKVIDKANIENLTVIVTDLFQEESDIEILSAKIKSKFISKNLAVGILALGSQFKGVIYDVGRRKDKFPYEQEEIAKLRPFYLLALGRHSDIARYFDGLMQTEISTFPITKSLIISPYLTEKSNLFSTTETKNIIGLNEVNGVIIENPESQSNFKEFTIKGKNGSPHYFETEIPFKSLPNTMTFSQPKTTIESCSCQTKPVSSDSPTNTNQNSSNSNTTSNNTTTDSAKNDVSALEILANFNDEIKPNETPSQEANTNQNSSSELKNLSGNKDKINLKVTVFPEKLVSGQGNCFRISLHPSKTSLPSWVSEWNMSNQNIEEWKSKNEPFDGKKTYNLAPFLQTILNLNNPKVADFYLFVKN